MEAAPLTQAHTHAQKAKRATQRSNPAAASKEHEIAAGYYGEAAESTTDPLAKRLSEQLKDHHTRLAEITMLRHEHLTGKYFETAQTSESVHPSLPDTTNSGEPPSSDTTLKPPVGRGPSMTSHSLAYDIAMARGIPTRSASGKPNMDKETASPTVKPSNNKAGSGPKESISSRNKNNNNGVPVGEQEPRKPQSKYDEAFDLYYNTIQGLVSRLSPQLAFPSMPLLSRFFAQETKPNKDAKFAKTLPDIRKFISPAAVESVNERRHGDPTDDSFYVVSSPDYEPIDAVTTGNGKGKAGRKTGGETTDDDTSSRSSSRVTRNTMKELRLENRRLRELTDNLTKHLREVTVNNPQSTAYEPSRAPEQHPFPSPRSNADNHHGCRSTVDQKAASEQQSGGRVVDTDDKHHPDTDNAAQRSHLQDFEQRLQQAEESLARALRDNAKMQNRWEELLKGARARRNVNRGKASRR